MNGKFWLEALPLEAGTNSLWLTARSAAGHLTQASLTVLRKKVPVPNGP